MLLFSSIKWSPHLPSITSGTVLAEDEMAFSCWLHWVGRLPQGDGLNISRECTDKQRHRSNYLSKFPILFLGPRSDHSSQNHHVTRALVVETCREEKNKCKSFVKMQIIASRGQGNWRNTTELTTDKLGRTINWCWMEWLRAIWKQLVLA